MPPKTISKSRYLAALQCPKRLWLEIHRYDLKDEVDQDTQAVFDQGQAVGELAQLLYPDGLLIAEDYLHLSQALLATEKAVNAGASALFEAAAQTDILTPNHALHLMGDVQLTARADILLRVKEDSNEWDLIEVKSTLDVKPLHVTDLAFQKHVFEKAGYPIRKTYIAHLNRDYVRQGPLDIQALFVLSDQTAAVDWLVKGLPPQVQSFEQIAALEKEPVFDIGPHCDKPYECPFKSHCWKDVPERSVFDLGGRTPFVWDLYKKGTKRLADIPDTMRLSAHQRKQIEAERTGETYWKIPAIQAFLDSLEYPLSFLDFETVAMAIPPYDGTKSFQTFPTQFSLHVVQKIEKDTKSPKGRPATRPPAELRGLVVPTAKQQLVQFGDDLQHFEFLGDGLTDPRQAFSEALVKAIPSQGTVLIYSSYEKAILRQTAEFLPKFKAPFNDIIQRCKDLASPFQRRDVVHPDFEGSFSIKYVLPALVPTMNYSDLAISNGNAAVRAYIQLMDPQVSEMVKKNIRKDLLTYCAQDTLAMVKLVEVLRERVNGGIG